MKFAENIHLVEEKRLLSFWLCRRRRQMETFSASLDFFEENPPVTGGFPSQRPVTQIFDVFFDPRLNERLSKQSKPLWFETPSHSSWRHCDANSSTQLALKSMKSLVSENYLEYRSLNPLNWWCIHWVGESLEMSRSLVSGSRKELELVLF